MTDKPKKGRGKKPAPKPEPAQDQKLKPLTSTALVIHANPGRPTVYTEHIVSTILERLAAGDSLRRICRNDPDLPAESTVRNWAIQDLNGFFARYARARDMGLDSMADETLDIADDGRNDTFTDEDGYTQVNWDHIARSKVRIDTRKWYLSRLAPKRYGALMRVDDKAIEPASLEPDYVLAPDEKGPDAPIL